MPQTKPVLASASGYRTYNVLKTPIVSQSLITRFYASSISGNITSKDIIPSELRQCGDQVIFRRAPIAEVFDYQKNQDLEVSTLNTEPIVMTVNRAKYWNFKLERVDEKQICDIQKWVKEFVANTAQIMSLEIDRMIFDELPTEASCFNKGKKAGARTGTYNLGALGAPVAINGGNIIKYLTYLSAVLDEANVPVTGRFVVFPSVAKTVFVASELGDACATGMNQSIIFGGAIPNIMGFTIYFSNNMPIYSDPAAPGLQTYLVIAGLKDATGFITQLSESEIIDQDTRSFSKYWRGLTVFDFKVLRPEALTVLYASFTV